MDDRPAGNPSDGDGPLAANEAWRSARSDPSPAGLVALVNLLWAGHGHFHVRKFRGGRIYLCPVLMPCGNFSSKPLHSLSEQALFSMSPVPWQTGSLHWMIGVSNINRGLRIYK